MQVRVANGGVLNYVQEYPQFHWEIQGQIFSTTFTVLPLNCYDIILGIDWLEQNSPMSVHWMKKLMSFLHQGRKVCLQGIKPGLNQCCMVWQQQQGDQRAHQSAGAVWSLGTVEDTDQEIPQQIELLLQDFDHLFAEPQGLPPQRVFDHAIPLMTGVKPVNLRPYSYNPAQKDEIEWQVTEMLNQGVI